MKLSTKLLLSYLAVAFLVLIVGASSYYLNKEIKDRLIEDSQHSITEMQRLSNLEYNLQNSLLFTRNFLFERSMERDTESSDIRLKSRSAETAARANLSRFSANLDAIRTEIPETELSNEALQDNVDQLEEFADSLSTSFEYYRSLILELFELEAEIDLADEMFNLTIEPYFRTTLLPILEEFRANQAVSIELQMTSLRSQADRNTRIIIIITCIAFIIASWLAYLIYHSIARPLNHLTLAAEEIGAGNLSRRIQIGTNDELDQLGKSFNKMAGNLNKSMVSREYVNDIIQSMGDMLIVTNASFEIQLINRSISETLQYQKKDLVGKQIWSIIRDQYVQNLKETIINSKQIRSFEARFKTIKGKEIPVIISFSRLKEKSSEEAGMVFVASNITAQKEAEEMLNRSLKEKEVLLAEIHHRVKNNLAVISGLLEMQVWNLPDDDRSVVALKESQLRIHSIALVHELLYQSESLSEIKLDEYINKLLMAIEQTHQNKDKVIKVITSLETVRLTIQKAIPVSLLLNELVVNSYKHGFNGKSEGEIEVILSENKDNVELIIQDNGVGLPVDFEPEKQTTLGMTLIKTLVQQIGARLQVDNRGEGMSGSKFIIHFEQG